MDRKYPFGKPLENITYDRQHYEDDAFRWLCASKDKLTPTGRLKKRVAPETFEKNVQTAIEKCKVLVEKFPEDSRYQNWLQEAETLLRSI